MEALLRIPLPVPLPPRPITRPPTRSSSSSCSSLNNSFGSKLACNNSSSSSNRTSNSSSSDSAAPGLEAAAVVAAAAREASPPHQTLWDRVAAAPLLHSFPPIPAEAKQLARRPSSPQGCWGSTPRPSPLHTPLAMRAGRWSWEGGPARVEAGRGAAALKLPFPTSRLPHHLVGVAVVAAVLRGLVPS